MRILKRVFAVLLMLCLVSCTSKVELVPLKLVEGRENKLVAAPELLTPQFVERMKAVLKHYGEDFDVSAQGALRISKKLSLDRELLWNYCTKAQDGAFLKTISVN